jgi:hypothetical protein
VTNVSVLLKAYFWLYGTFTLILIIATASDVTHVGDVLNVLAAVAASLGLYAYLHKRTLLGKGYWLAILSALVLYDVAVIVLILSTVSQPLGFHWLLGSTAVQSKLYDLFAIVFSIPALVGIFRLAASASALPRTPAPGHSRPI